MTDLIGTGTAARILGVSPRTVKRQARDGDLPYVSKLDGELGSYVFDRADVIAIAEQRVEAEAQRLAAVAAEGKAS